MPNITMPNGDVVTFPDDMPPDRIAALISSKFPNEVQHQLEQSGKADNPLIATGKMAINAFLSDFPQAFSGLKQQFTEGVAGDPNALEKKIGPDFKINDASIPVIDQQNILKWGAQRLGLPAASTQATDMLGEYGWPDAAQVSKIEAFIKTPQGKAELIAMLKGQTPDYKPMGTPYDVVQKAQEAGKKERAAIEAGRIPVNVVPNSLIGAVESGVSSVAQMAPAIGASILLRNPLPAMAQAQLLAQGQSYGQARDQGLSPEQAGQYAILTGAAEGLPEAIPVGLLLKQGIGSFIKEASKQVLAEGFQEGLTELLQIGLDKGYITPDMTLAEAKNRLSTAVIGGAFGGGIMHTAVHGPHSFMTPKPDERPDAGPAAVELDLGAPSPATNSVAPNAMTAEQQAASAPVQQAKENATNILEQTKRLALPAPTIEDEAPSVAVTPPPPGETVREKQAVKTAQLLAAAREVTTPVGAFSVPEVGPTIAGKVNLWRSRTGRNIDAPITVADMQAARVEQPLIDELVISRKPITKIGTEASAQQAGTISAGINADINQQRYNDAVAAVRKAGRFTLKTVQDATGITNVNEARAIRDQMVQRGEIIQTKPNTFKLPEQPKTEATKAAPIATYTVAPAAPETVAVKKDGKIHGVYTTQKEAAAEVRAIRAREKETGTQPGRVEVVNGGVDAEGKAIAGRPAFAVYENSYDEAGNSVGRTIVSTHATEEGAANAAKGLNNQPKAQRAAATAATASAKPTRGQPSPAAPLPQVPDVIAGREQEIIAGLDKLAKQRGVPTLGVKVKLVGSITDPSTGATVEGSYLNGVVRIALDKLSPDMTTEEIIDALAAVMDHELIHALRDAGLLADGTPAWKTLVNYVAQGRHPDTGLTFLQWAAQSPEDGGYSDMSPSIQIEEAMAEAFRYWAKNRRAVGGAPGTVFNQIARWFKNLTSSIPADLFRAVETGSLVRANIKPPASKRMEAVDAMADARAKMTAAATPEEAADAQRDFLRARDQAEADRVGRVGPRTVLGTTPSDEFMIGPRASFDTVEALNAKADTLKLAPTPNYNTPDTGFMRKLADAYQNAKHQPSDTAVFKAYSALTTEVRSLFDALNVKVVPWRQSGQPYIDQRDLIDDIVNNGEVKMRLSAEMFPAHPTRKHPMQEQSSVVAADGTALTHDDLMRVVTEAFGYAPVASVASEVGDYRAYHTIKGMFSERAQKALPTEMLAQSAWHNYGPKMRLDDGSIAPEGALGFVEPVKREFAERKATILPDAVLVEPVQEAALDITGMGEVRYSRTRPENVPKKTVKAYKLFRTDKRAPGQLFPLFVDANTPVPVGQWVDAEAGEPGKTPGMVKAKGGQLAYRPGWHAGDLPLAHHIGGKSHGKKNLPPDYRRDTEVWAEVEMPDDVDWQSIANSRAKVAKAGNIIPKTAAITDQVPYGGHYRYKTNPNMTGNWLIGGSMKVNRVLSDDEVKAINDAAGVADLPRLGEARYSRGVNPQVNTPEFKRWFGNSKVVDATGKPLVVYHGTGRDFTNFDTQAPSRGDAGGGSENTDTGWFGKGFYFTPSTSAASYWASMKSNDTQQNVMPVYLALRNPLVLDIAEYDSGARSLGKALARMGFFENSPTAQTAFLQKEGYEGVITRRDGRVDELVAFDPTQIKSATGNTGAFDPANPDIRYSRGVNKHGLAEYLRQKVNTDGLNLPPKAIFTQATTNANAQQQIDQITPVLNMFPDALKNAEGWGRMMAYALADNDVPAAPYRLIKDLNDGTVLRNLKKMTPGQIADADHGFENAAKMRAAYTSGAADIDVTGKLFLWSFLSRGVSPYTQEGLFIDAFNGIEPWLNYAARGQWDPSHTERYHYGTPEQRQIVADYLNQNDMEKYAKAKADAEKSGKPFKELPPEKIVWSVNPNGTVNMTYKLWARLAAPAGLGLPGAGATHNLNAFGDDFLAKMSQPAGDGTGRSRLRVIHDMMGDPRSTGPAIRRKFMTMGEGVGIDNKVVSFTLLVAGFPDVMVLDRVQVRQLWNDGRFGDVNLYDGIKENNKPVTGTALSDLTYGARGLLVYEAIERELGQRVNDIYAALGRPQDASIGRYHWDTWVTDSGQEASHGTLGAILPPQYGGDTLSAVTAKQGEYGSYAYGARYGVSGNGTSYFNYETPDGKTYIFTVPGFVEFQQELKKPKNKVVPQGFSVTGERTDPVTKKKIKENFDGPWFTRPEVDTRRLTSLAAQYAVGEAGTEPGSVRAGNGQQDIPTGFAARPYPAQRELYSRGINYGPAEASLLDKVSTAKTYNVGSPQFYEMLDEVMPGGKHYGKADRSAAAVVMPVTTSAPAFSRDYDGNVFFGGDIAYQQLQMTRDGDRGAVLTYMAPEDFLRLADQQPMREQRLFNEAAGAGYKFNTMPSLVVESGKTGAVPVLNSDGVAIARALLGQAKTIPVVLYPSGNGQIENITTLEANGNVVDAPSMHEFDIERRGPRHNLSSVAFNAWFKQSAVVDEADAPKRMYHNTRPDRDFGIFNTQKSEFGAHFGTPEQANDVRGTRYGHGYPVYLSIQNPIRLDDVGMFHSLNVAENLLRLGVIDEDLFRAVIANTVNGQVVLQDALIEKGYDGVVYLNRREGVQLDEDTFRDGMTDAEFKAQYPDAQDSYIVFQPTQVKSAIANRGTWSSADPDIRYSRGRPRVRVGSPGSVTYNGLYDRATGWFATFVHNAGRSRAKLTVGDTSLPSIFGTRIALQDNFLAIKDMYDKWAAAGITIPAELNAYIVEQSVGSAAAYQIQKREEHFVKPLTAAVRSGIKAKRFKYDDVQDFLYALHAPERNAFLKARGSTGGAGITDAEAAAVIANAKANGTFDELSNIARMAQAIVRDINLTRVATGQITASVFALSPFSHWVPLRDTDDYDPFDEIAKGPRSDGVGNAFTSFGKRPDKRMFGRTSKAGDILANLVTLQATTVMRGERARVGKALVETVRQAEAEGVELPNLRIMKSPRKVKAYGSDGMIREIIDPNARNKKGVIVFKVDGEEVMLETDDPYVDQALKSPMVQFYNKFLTLLMQIRRIHTAMITSRDPNFVLTNFIRDAEEALINAGQYDVKNIVGKVLAGIPQAGFGITEYQIKKGAPTSTNKYTQYYAEMVQNGWIVSFLAPQNMSKTLNRLRRDTGNLSKPGEILANTGKVVDWAMDKWDGFNNVTEGTMRLSLYAALREAGASVTEAGVAAKNLTINFNKGGRYKAAMDTLYLFGSVTMNSMAVTGRMLKSKRGLATMSSIAALGFLMGVLNRALSDDDDKNGVKDYDQISESELARNIILPIDKLGIPGITQPFKIPMAIGTYGAVFNIGRNIERAIDGFTNPRQPIKADGAAARAFFAFAEAVNPVGSSNSPATFIAPWFVDPWIELAANKNWADMDIMPPSYDTTKPDSQRYYRTTDQMYVAAAKLLNDLTGGNDVRAGALDWSPEHLQYWAEFFTAGSGRFLTDAKYTLFEATQLWMQGKEADLSKVPFVKRFVPTAGVQRGGQDLFYTLRDEVEVTKNELADPALRAAGRTRIGSAASVQGAFSSADRQLKALRQQLSAAMENKTMTDAARMLKIKAIQDKMAEVRNKAVAAYYNRADKVSP